MLRALPSYLLVVLLLSAAGTGTLWSQQPIPEVTANPNAAMLRRIWTLTGDGPNAGLGSGAGGVGDVNNDGIDDFALFGGTWRIYAGGSPAPSLTPMWELASDGSRPFHPIHGDFWGTGENCVGFVQRQRIYPNDTKYYLPIHVFRPVEGVLPTEPTVTFNEATLDSLYSVQDFFAVDLDQDGDDELIVLLSNFLRKGEPSNRAEVWIFEGGAEFSLNAPTRILRDNAEHNNNIYALVDDFNGDSFSDILIAGFYYPRPTTAALKFWWGGDNLADLATEPDRTIALLNSLYPRIGYGITAIDCDNDGSADLWLPGPDGNMYLYRMGIAGKDPFTRALSLSDADAVFRAEGFTYPVVFGALNDSSGRFPMLGLSGGTSQIPWGIIALSGSSDGPDSTYDTYYSGVLDETSPTDVVLFHYPVGDVTGDGWEDLLSTYPDWGADQGIAIILEGGPYIPHDDPTVSVREVPVDDYADALHLWPNPVNDQLSLAWRGDLTAMPRQARIYDTRGQLVAEHQLNSAGRPGSAVLDCSALPVGSYLLQLSDEHRQQITTTHILIMR